MFSLNVVINAAVGERKTIYKARAGPLSCSEELLFCEIPVAAAVWLPQVMAVLEKGKSVSQNLLVLKNLN